MKRRTFFCALASPLALAGQNSEFETRVFRSGKDTVLLVQRDNSIDPYVTVTAASGDIGILDVFYRETVVLDGEAVPLLRRKTANGPFLSGSPCGYDLIPGLQLAAVVKVCVTLLHAIDKRELLP